MANAKHIIRGEKFGLLTVISEAPRPHGSDRRWVTASCECGVIKNYAMVMLRVGKTKSCGCLRTKVALSRTRHGHGGRTSATRIYQIWRNMNQRCANPKNNRYSDYGGRGIKVCDRWSSFENFLADMGEPGPEMSIDRYPDKNGNYEPGNCRWATAVEQGNNTRRNHVVEFRGRSMTIAEWSRELDIPVSALHRRIQSLKWPIERALTEPIRKT